MKNLKIVKNVTFLIVTISIFSCSKKEWTCTCTSDIDGSIVEISNYELTESDAISACDNKDSESEKSCVLEKQ